MRLNKAALLLISLTLLFAGFCAGFYVGLSKTGDVRLDTVQANSKQELKADTEEENPAEDTEMDEGEPEETAEGPMNINTATVRELMELPGIGESLARAIVDYREANGPFEKTEDLQKVYGIGAGKYAAVSDLVCAE